MTTLNMIRDVAGKNTFGTQFSTNTAKTILAAGVEQHTTVPTGFSNGKWLAIMQFEPGTKVWVTNNATATVPASTFAGSTGSSVLNPPPKEVSGGDVLSFITDDASAEVSVEYQALED